ncbi:hypothetical protein SPI_08656 [Niveomyces insectorum RCEF 264]|uniref:Uncharacterized protein n=1 Tax=Niveomyces insectorum RCEF 264 TaxID=1081102 RepID=A0A162IBI1_9HYPO|nr:hypothetical protein SPI_08656 [Niveomyces insectorum RCEF 264]
MAFQQPTRLAVPRRAREEADDRDDNDNAITTTTVTAPQQAEASQTWVLFSPTAETDATTAGATSVLGSVPASQDTAGRSRISDLGSLQSLGRTDYASSDAQQSAVAPTHPADVHASLLTSPVSRTDGGNRGRDDDDAIMGEAGRRDAEDDAELDSLDSHLPDFRPLFNHHAQGQPSAAVAAAVAAATVNLPAHDGLGSFRLGGNTVGMSAAVQEHLYAFEQFNPRRVTKRRRESLDLAPLQAENEQAEDMERTRRIEAWRLEHSRVLLDEIQKETRRRKGHTERFARPGRAADPSGAAGALSDRAAFTMEVNGDWHDQEEDERLSRQRTGQASESADADAEEKEGLWSRITRKFMLEVMGIDERILTILFGEGLVDDDDDDGGGGGSGEIQQRDDAKSLPPTFKAFSPFLAATAAIDAAEADPQLRPDEEDTVLSPSWQLRMLERIAKELGVFVHNHITAHPGAFATFVRVQQMPLPYAGLPVIPEAAPVSSPMVAADDARDRDRTVEEDMTPTGTTASLPQFKPTIYQAKPMMHIPDQVTAAHAPISGFGTTGGAAAAAAAAAAGATSGTKPAAAPHTFTQDEWEQDLDIKLVFRYLRSRFFPGAASSSAGSHTHRHHNIHYHHHYHSHGHVHSHSYGHDRGHGPGSSCGNSTGTLNLQEAAAKAARVRQHHPLVGRGAAARPVGSSSPVLGLRAVTQHGAMGAAAAAAAVSCASQSTRRSARRSSVSSRPSSSRPYWDIGGSIGGTGSLIASAGPMGSWGEV